MDKKKKDLATILAIKIGEGKKGKKKEESEEAPEASEELDIAAEEVMEAVNEGDVEGLRDSLKSFIHMCLDEGDY